MEARTDLQQRGDTSAGADSAHSRGGDLTQEFQQGTFAGAVLADDAYHIALLDLEVDIAQRPDVVGVGFLGTVIDRTDLEVGILAAQDGSLPPAVEVVADGAGGDKAEAVLLADVVEFNCCCHCCLYILNQKRINYCLLFAALGRFMSSRLNRR